MFQDIILERKAESEYMALYACLPRRGAKPESVGRMSSVCLFLVLVTARHCARLPLALLLATINLR